MDDELNIRKALAACLEADGHRVFAVGNSADAAAAVNHRSFDVAFVDMLLGKDSALELIPQLLAAAPWMKIVVITAYASVDSAVESMKRGAADYLPKPFTPAQVSLAVKKVAELRALEHRLADLAGSRWRRCTAGGSGHQQPGDAAGHQPGARGRRQRCDGTHPWGKRDGQRRSGPRDSFLEPPGREAVCHGRRAPLSRRNCWKASCLATSKGRLPARSATIPGESRPVKAARFFSMKSATFHRASSPSCCGFCRIAVTSAWGSRPRALRMFECITATNVDLEKAVAEGRFREDLLYRINVIRIDLPPLRERRDDIAPMAREHVAAPGPPASKAGDGFQRGGARRAAGLSLAGQCARAAKRRRAGGDSVPRRAGGARASDARAAPTNRRSPAPTRRLATPLQSIALEELHIRAVLATTPSIEKAAADLGDGQRDTLASAKKVRHLWALS